MRGELLDSLGHSADFFAADGAVNHLIKASFRFAGRRDLDFLYCLGGSMSLRGYFHRFRNFFRSFRVAEHLAASAARPVCLCPVGRAVCRNSFGLHKRMRMTERGNRSGFRMRGVSLAGTGLNAIRRFRRGRRYRPFAPVMTEGGNRHGSRNFGCPRRVAEHLAAIAACPVCLCSGGRAIRCDGFGLHKRVCMRRS